MEEHGGCSFWGRPSDIFGSGTRGTFEISTDGNHYSHELKYMDMGQWEWSKFEISPNRIFKLCMA